MKNLISCLMILAHGSLLGTLACSLMSAKGHAAIFPDGISNLKQLKSRIIAKVTKLDHDIEQIVYRTQTHKVGGTSDSQRVIRFTDNIKRLHELKKELQARQKFLDQLIYAYTQYGPFSNQLEQMPQLLFKMAVRESQSSQPDFKLVEFMTHLSRALRDLCEPQEDVFAFIESYMNYSTILEPKPPSSYARNVRHYVGSKSVETVKQISVKTSIKSLEVD